MTSDCGWRIHRYDSVTSTMDAAAQLATAGAPQRTVVVGQEQTRGRGRSVRTWQAPRGTALFCTIVLRPNVPADRLTTLPLVTAVAVAETIERLSGATVQLKWPNDVWLGSDPHRRKVAGILASTSLHRGAVVYALVGIGMNISTALADLPTGATSLHAATGCTATIEDVLKLLLDRFDRVYDEFLTTDGRPSLDSWRSRAALIGERVMIEEAGHRLEGIFAGIDDDGALLLAEPGGASRRIVSGDLMRGPRKNS